ncbi:PRA1 family protein B4-like [Salvia miltiorrhiza]|uniref:PRA1 family protein B4-like n=1 Tax=Salvia miltiorrhiza TaxID=226208 RepID=UPI0025ACAE65|nr:PRA1 family protein B4-like [Salvia miltiorrhiza]
MAAGANSSPAILPISNAAAQPPTAAGNQQLSSNSSVRLFLTAISDNIRFGLANRRPWSEVVDRSAFSKPESISEATLRLRKNYNYFRTNYLTIVTAVLAFSLLTNPFSLILLSGLLAAWLFLYVFRQASDPPIVFFGRQYSDRETLLFLIVSTVAVIFLTSVGSVLVSALMIGVAVVSLHGAFRAPEDLFLDEQEPQGGVPGFLTLLSGGAVATSQAPMPARA